MPQVTSSFPPPPYVRQGFDAAEFSKGVKRAEDRLDSLRKKFGITQKSVEAAGVVIGASMAAAAAGIALGIRNAINQADRIGELAEQIGLSAEKLSALGYAAQINGASMDEFGKGIRTVSRNMLDAAKAPNDFSRSLDALGVDWREANGQFRAADAVFLDVAERFAGMRDGAGEVALAMKLFGEEVGPKLLPLLNRGRDGIQSLTDEAKRFGQVVSDEAAYNAGRFHENMDRLNKRLGGVFNTLSEKVTPSLVFLTDKLLGATNETRFLEGAVERASGWFKVLSAEIIKTGTTLQILNSIGDRYSEAQRELFDTRTPLDNLSKAWEALAKIKTDNVKLLELEKKLLTELDWAGSTAIVRVRPAQDNRSDPPGSQSAQSVEDQKKEKANRAVWERLRIIEEMRTPEEEMIARQEKLRELFQGGAKDAVTYGRAMAHRPPRSRQETWTLWRAR